MQFRLMLTTFAVVFSLASINVAWTDDAADKADAVAEETDSIDGMEPLFVPLKDRDAPSDEEWDALQHDTRGFFDGIADFRKTTISFMDTEYFTLNRAEGTLASYGKADGKKGFDRYGHIAGVQFEIPKNSWKERYALNAAALVKLTGQARFAEFAGVELDTAVQDRRQMEVTFVGTIVPKDEAVRRLNADVDALDYLGALYDKRLAYQQKRFKLIGTQAPPEPKIVLANVLMLDSKSSKYFDGGVGAKATSIIHGYGGELKLVRQTGEESTLLTPVVRCYRTYSIEFKTDSNGNLQRVAKRGPDGERREVPVVFDLTPDL